MIVDTIVAKTAMMRLFQDASINWESSRAAVYQRSERPCQTVIRDALKGGKLVLRAGVYELASGKVSLR